MCLGVASKRLLDAKVTLLYASLTCLHTQRINCSLCYVWPNNKFTSIVSCDPRTGQVSQKTRTTVIRRKKHNICLRSSRLIYLPSLARYLQLLNNQENFPEHDIVLEDVLNLSATLPEPSNNTSRPFLLLDAASLSYTLSNLSIKTSHPRLSLDVLSTVHIKPSLPVPHPDTIFSTSDFVYDANRDHGQ